jgi:hypothetical protein
MNRSEIINLFIVRAAPADRTELRRKLERMSLDELEQAHQALISNQELETKEEELLKIQAERAANAALHKYVLQKTREPQRKAEEKAQLDADRKTFADAARSLQSFALNEANFSVIRTTLGPNFTTYSIQQAIGSNALELSPPTQQELDEWERQAVEAHNLRLLNADIPTLRKLAREAGARGAAAPQFDETQRVRAAERNDGIAYPRLPDEIRIGDREELIDAAFIKRCSKEVLRSLIKRYGSDQVTEALRTRISGVTPLW